MNKRKIPPPGPLNCLPNAYWNERCERNIGMWIFAIFMMTLMLGIIILLIFFR